MRNAAANRQSTRRNAKRSAALRASLANFMTTLSEPLLAAGIQPSEFTDLVKRAFVTAAEPRCRLRNGRVNDSRVAVVTGLSRQEIARIRASSPYAFSERSIEPLDWILNNWASDPEFSRAGNPKALPLFAAPGGFGSLVKKHGGDVTARAVLQELISRKLVRVSNGRVVPTKKELQIPDSTARLLMEITRSLSTVVKALSARQANGLRRSFSLHLIMPSGREKLLLQKKVELAIETTFDALSTLGQTSQRKSGTRKRHLIDVLTFIDTSS
jgi:hypothetical protein